MSSRSSGSRYELRKRGWMDKFATVPEMSWGREHFFSPAAHSRESRSSGSRDEWRERVFSGLCRQGPRVTGVTSINWGRKYFWTQKESIFFFFSLKNRSHRQCCRASSGPISLHAETWSAIPEKWITYSGYINRTDHSQGLSQKTCPAANFDYGSRLRCIFVAYRNLACGALFHKNLFLNHSGMQ